ncbi:transcriptional regulator [Streptococcus marmotae]|uniref:transcriptional regulator n=1 Tax=Streptococcus marmotae TaxID=1825069 RepID=UPI000836F551|nr:transcriptional regulator [Streptococcus marmotae]
MDFKRLYLQVRPIVVKARKEYYIKSWEVSDWDQEGMYILYCLLEREAGIEEDPSRLYRYYKVKFRNYIKDIIRKQESQKRKFDRMSYEEIGEVSHKLGSGGLVTDELICLRDRLSSYRSQLSEEEVGQYELLISGRNFKGRRKMLRELRVYLED